MKMYKTKKNKIKVKKRSGMYLPPESTDNKMYVKDSNMDSPIMPKKKRPNSYMNKGMMRSMSYGHKR